MTMAEASQWATCYLKKNEETNIYVVGCWTVFLNTFGVYANPFVEDKT